MSSPLGMKSKGLIRTEELRSNIGRWFDMERVPHHEFFKVSIEKGVVSVEVNFTTKIPVEDALNAIINARRLRRGSSISLDFLLAGLSQELTEAIIKASIEFIDLNGFINSEDPDLKVGDGIE